MRSVSFHSFRWDRESIWRYSGSNKYLSWIPIGMPRIPEDALDSVFYLYRQTYEADSGTNTAGTGFFYGYPCKQSRLEGAMHIYAVTNHHIVVDEGAAIARVNLKGGRTTTFGNEPDEWIVDEDFDIALLPIRPEKFNWRQYVVFYLGKDFCVDTHYIQEYDIGLGDDVFMIGHFRDYKDANQINDPFSQPNYLAKEAFN